MGEVGEIAAAMDLLAGGPGGGATELGAPAEASGFAAMGHVRPVPAPIEEDLRVDRGGAEQERAQDRRAVFAAGRAGHRRELPEDVAAIAAGRAAELDALVEMEAPRVELAELDVLMVIPSRAQHAAHRIDDAGVRVVGVAIRMIAEEFGDAAQARRVADVVTGSGHEDVAGGGGDAAVEVTDDADVRRRRQQHDPGPAAVGGELGLNERAGAVRRSVVTDDDLVVRQVLLEHRAQGGHDVGLLLIGKEDDADRRQAHRAAGRSAMISRARTSAKWSCEKGLACAESRKARMRSW